MERGDAYRGVAENGEGGNQLLTFPLKLTESHQLIEYIRAYEAHHRTIPPAPRGYDSRSADFIPVGHTL
jgi:hypothetical protein